MKLETATMGTTKSRKTKSNSSSILNLKDSLSKQVRQFFQRANLTDLLFNPEKCHLMACLLFLLEILIHIWIISTRQYTEIDWVAYMQEVEGVQNGTFDYSQLKGDTGPLVYPAGFVWIFTGLYYITNNGTNIKLAQCLFAVLYLINIGLVFYLMSKSKKVPPYTLAIMTLTSYRIHSIFTLRLFNDPVAMTMLYGAIALFVNDYWSLGSLIYSLAVSVKMNILLVAPALLFAYVATQGLVGTIKQLAICASLQVVLAIPFLMAHPVNYIKGAFNLGRVFLFKWTVNWRFLPEWLFVNPGFHLGLLVLHLLALVVAFPHCWVMLQSYAKLMKNDQRPDWTLQLLLLPLFFSNFIGMCFARSLHYQVKTLKYTSSVYFQNIHYFQFYVWYYHQLPYLLWCTKLPTLYKLLVLGLIEMCWNTYPSTVWSSATLHTCHFVILIGVYLYIRDGVKQKDN